MDEHIESNVDELVELVRALVRFDTTSVDLSPGSAHTANEEAGLQAYVAERLRAIDAEVDQWEPDAAEFAGHPMMPPWHHWQDRPLTVGTIRGTGGGRASSSTATSTWSTRATSPGGAPRRSRPTFATAASTVEEPST